MSTKIGVFNSLTHEFIENIDIPYYMGHNGLNRMRVGHLKVSEDGTLIFIQVPDGIYSLRTSVPLDKLYKL